jgi:hypothetical protein
MRTKDFEQRLMDSIANATRQSWWHILQQKHNLKLVKRKVNTKYAGVTYSRVLTFEVPTLEGNVLMTIGERGSHLDFYYFAITPDDDSDENLNDLYERHEIMRALRGR